MWMIYVRGGGGWMCKSLILFVEDVMVFVIKMKFEELGRR